VIANHSDESSSRSLYWYFTLILGVVLLHCIMDFQKTLQATHVLSETQPEV